MGFFQSNSQSSQPNIIFILADDLSYRDLSCYGQQQYKTPNIDALATRGIRFTQAYAAAPECAPSRCSLLTGLHTGHSSVRTNSSARGQDNLKKEDLTIAEVLKELGYNTGFTGKWGIGLPGTEGVPWKQGFDYSFGFYDQTRAHTYIPYYLEENDKKIEFPENFGFDMARRYDYLGNKPQNTYDENGKLFIEELKNPKVFSYSENEIEKAAFRFLDTNNPGKTGKPFFLYYATQLPHGPVIVDDLGEMKNFPEVMQLSREWAAMVLKLDRFVGELVASLKTSGQYENTVLFFASDNGYSMCGYTDRGNAPDWPDDPWLENKGPFTGGKFSVLEGGCRVPFFVSWPAKYQASIVNEPVWLPDFFPTAVAMAGGNPLNYKTDGKNLVPVLEGNLEQFEGHKYLYFSKGPEQAVRMGAWKAYRKNPEAPTELYLVEEDTYTKRNLSLLYPEKVREAEEIMIREHEPSEWYWNPWESREQYLEKQKRAAETGNKLPAFRPNGMKKLPWEK
jgi:arylsulfatase